MHLSSKSNLALSSFTSFVNAPILANWPLRTLSQLNFTSRIKKEMFTFFQKKCHIAWDEYVQSQAPTANPDHAIPNATYYPHGLCAYQPAYKDADLPGLEKNDLPA